MTPSPVDGDSNLGITSWMTRIPWQTEYTAYRRCARNYENLMTVHSVIAIPMGVTCMLAPAAMLANYGLALSPMGLVIYQFWGTALLGLGMLTWVFRSAEEARVQTGSSLTMAIIHIISCAMAVRGQWTGPNDFGWSAVAPFLVLALAFAYVRFINLSKAQGGTRA